MGQILARQEEGQDSRRRTISFSSEAPYRRYFGMEILDHAEGAVDLGRLNSVGVLLFNHDVDKVVGRVIRAWLENNRGMAEVEFDTDADAEKVFSKVQSGTLKTTSVRYSVAAGRRCGPGPHRQMDASPAPARSPDGGHPWRSPLFPCRRTPPWAWADPAKAQTHRTCPHTSGRSKSIKILLGGKEQ